MRLALILAALSAAPLAAQTPAADLEVARGVLAQGLKDHPANAELHTLLGFVYRKMEKLDDAEKSFSEAVKANPRKAEAHYMMGMIREKKGLKEQARLSWKACLEAAVEPAMKETARQHLALLGGKDR